MRLALILALLAEACSSQDKPTPVSVKLSGSEPTVRVELDAAMLSRGPGRLQFAVSDVRNAALSAVNVVVEAVAPKGAGRRKLVGSFTLFPPDQPGVFHLAAPADLPRDSKGRVRLELRLERPPVQKAAPALSLTIAVRVTPAAAGPK